MSFSAAPTSWPQVLSRLSSEEFFNREAPLEELRRAASGAAPRATVIIGPPRAGKTELLRTAFDLLFHEAGRTLPVYYSLRRDRLTADRFAKDFLLTLLRQYLAFKRSQAELIARQELTPRELVNLATAEEYLAIKELLDGYDLRLAEGGSRALVRYALGAPQLLAARSPYRLAILLDEAQWLDRVIEDEESPDLLGELLRPPSAVSFFVTGLQRALLDQLSAEEGLLGELKLLRLDSLDLPSLQALVAQWCARQEVAAEHDAVRLLIQQLGGNLFYLRSMIAAASERKLSLETGAEVEQLYVEELLQGRIAHFFSGHVRRIAQDAASGQGEHAALEIIYICAEALASRAPVEFIEHKVGARFSARRLLAELHHHELVTVLDDHVLPSEDNVFCDWADATHRRFEGDPVSEVKLDLLRRRIKAVPRLLALNARRTLHARIESLLKRFDGQSLARSLFSHDEFLIRYGRAKYQLMLAGLKAEAERVKLPQLIYVTESPLFDASRDLSAASWSCLLAYGFDDGVYDNDHEVVWVLAVTDSPAAVTAEAVMALDAQLDELRDPLSSGKDAPRVVRWAVSKMGFTLDAVVALEERGFSASDYLQLELLAECLDAAEAEPPVAAPEAEAPAPATRDFELAIPLNDEKEIIAARVAEQIAKTAGFAPEEVNQIKTALIEACLSLTAIGHSPDGRIHQRYRLDDAQMTIIVSNSAAGLDETGGSVIEEDPDRIWRLAVLRSLVDQVRLTRFDDGWRVALSKNRK
jgi:anti-sigma regulatory factor (Ser/Thr protein kinase)